MLTPRQNAFLAYIRRRLAQANGPLSCVELKDAMKASSLTSVYRAIAALEKQGFITCRHGLAGDIEILRAPVDEHRDPSTRVGASGAPPLATALEAANAAAAKASGGGPGPSIEVPREARRCGPANSPRRLNSVHETAAREALLMATDLSIIARARELVGDPSWTRLSAHEQASVLRSQLYERSGSHDWWPDVGESSTSHRSPAPNARAADAMPHAEPPRDGRMMAYPPGQSSPESANDDAAPGTRSLGILPTSEALRLATDATRGGYGLTEPTRNPEIVAQAIELSFLLTALGLDTEKPDIAMVQPDTVKEVSPRPARPREAAYIARSSGTGRHVLVVDDASDVLVTVTAFLVSAGFVVTTAADGDSALRRISTDPLIGVLVTDFAMPGLSGADLIVQSIQLRPDLKALLITGFPNADGLADLPRGVEVLAKPFRRAALIERVGILTGGMRPADSRDVARFAHVNK